MSPSGYRRIDEHRYRERVGLSYAELTKGMVFEHRPGRTVTEMDNVLMSTLMLNPSPLHIDAEYAKAVVPEGRPLVSSLVTLNIVASLSVRSTSGEAIANLGWKNIALTAPVFAGDTLYAESQVLAKRVSTSNPLNGIVSVATRGIVRDIPVIEFERSFLIRISDAAVY